MPGVPASGQARVQTQLASAGHQSHSGASMLLLSFLPPGLVRPTHHKNGFANRSKSRLGPLVLAGQWPFVLRPSSVTHSRPGKTVTAGSRMVGSRRLGWVSTAPHTSKASATMAAGGASPKGWGHGPPHPARAPGARHRNTLAHRSSQSLCANSPDAHFETLTHRQLGVGSPHWPVALGTVPLLWFTGLCISPDCIGGSSVLPHGMSQDIHQWQANCLLVTQTCCCCGSGGGGDGPLAGWSRRGFHTANR